MSEAGVLGEGGYVFFGRGRGKCGRGGTRGWGGIGGEVEGVCTAEWESVCGGGVLPVAADGAVGGQCCIGVDGVCPPPTANAAAAPRPLTPHTHTHTSQLVHTHCQAGVLTLLKFPSEASSRNFEGKMEVAISRDRPACEQGGRETGLSVGEVCGWMQAQYLGC